MINPNILEDVRAAIDMSKSGKAKDPDRIPAEIIKILDDGGIKILTKLFNNIYECNP